MRTLRAIVACTVLAVALMVAILHRHPTATDRSGGTARAADRADTPDMAPAATAAVRATSDDYGWRPIRVTDW
jgi:FtsP/CotA-like multicopper oxidase with cupredoxin domain